jgi:hypothetical protein
LGHSRTYACVQDKLEDGLLAGGEGRVDLRRQVEDPGIGDVHGAQHIAGRRASLLDLPEHALAEGHGALLGHGGSRANHSTKHQRRGKPGQSGQTTQ